MSNRNSRGNITSQEAADCSETSYQMAPTRKKKRYQKSMAPILAL